MNLRQTRLHFLDQPLDLSKHASTGVSLHCHTLHSKETMDFVPFYAKRIPLVAQVWQKECRRYVEREGKEPDFATGFWLPPWSGAQVFQSEKEQLNQYGLEAFVSITDHDCIGANLELNEHVPNAQGPISMEWTVPIDHGFFHVGVHNLPPESATEIKDVLLGYTHFPEVHQGDGLHEIFSRLNEMPSVLVVLNHPVWDIEMAGEAAHLDLLKTFIAEYGKWIHALEINGFRSWSENKAVIELAETLGFQLISGGDRHCCENNTMINLTDAKTFADFVDEIRTDRYSEVVLMPKYREPLTFRQIRSFAQILSDYPAFPEGRQRWTDRVHIEANGDSGTQPLTHHWKDGEPTWLPWARRTLGVLSHESLRTLFRWTRSRADKVPKQSRDYVLKPSLSDRPKLPRPATT